MPVPSVMSNPDAGEARTHTRRVAGGELATLLDREWLVTNGLGGYASGTVAGAATRRYHGLLIAAHPAPLGRVMALSVLTEQFRFPGYRSQLIGGAERPGGGTDVHGADVLAEFRLEYGLPVWVYRTDGHTIEKRLYLPHKSNTVHVFYQLLDGPGPVQVKLWPAVHFRGHDDAVTTPTTLPYTLTATDGLYELGGGLPKFPALRFKIEGHEPTLSIDPKTLPDVLFRTEESRGYEGVGGLYEPGVFRVKLQPEKPVVLSASTETWDRMLALPALEGYEVERTRRVRLIESAPAAARGGFGSELVLAADQFLITPAARVMEQARAQALGHEARTVIAGYHWFTDWGRDTMISLDGLTLATGRFREAESILKSFAHHVKDGLIPNFFPDRGTVGLYHTADASLWFFHAVRRYVEATDDRDTLRVLLPTLLDIVAHHQAGTHYGIGVDPADGLLRQGQDGYQLTWMDAKVGDWVVTPRRGKAVEINALWYNALKLTEGWVREAGDTVRADEFAAAAAECRESFNRRFWNEAEGCLWDVLDGEAGDDPAVRPNQLFAISLDHPVLDESRWAAVVDVCRKKLVTPVGLRSLAPGSPDYKSRYFGDLRSRDAAYHQGTVWGWLVGPFVDAWRKVHPDDPAAGREFLDGFREHLSEACVGSISEVFDAEPPYTPRACIAQAWSVAEVLRCWVKTSGE